MAKITVSGIMKPRTVDQLSSEKIHGETVKTAAAARAKYPVTRKEWVDSLRMLSIACSDLRTAAEQSGEQTILLLVDLWMHSGQSALPQWMQIAAASMMG